ncbi:MAG: zinc-ribbon domain containing protein [Agathobacter sp.]|nr:zinc-ribbon domain containing protein [Agathobacter sp.]
MRKTCKQCGEMFEISQSEIEFYKKKNLNIPKRCKKCREENKKRYNSTTVGGVTDEKETGTNQAVAGKSTVKRTGGSKSGGNKSGANNSSENKAMIRQMNNRPVEANNNSNYNKKKHRILSKVISAVVTLLLISGVGYEAYKNFNEKAAGVSYDTNKSEENVNKEYSFRNEDLLNQHYEKHGKEMGYDSPEAYEEGAVAVINNTQAMKKQENEDNDDVYYVKDTNELVIVSTDGYIRTYFNPSDGIEYFERQ